MIWSKLVWCSCCYFSSIFGDSDCFGGEEPDIGKDLSVTTWAAYSCSPSFGFESNSASCSLWDDDFSNLDRSICDWWVCSECFELLMILGSSSFTSFSSWSGKGEFFFGLGGFISSSEVSENISEVSDLNEF